MTRSWSSTSDAGELAAWLKTRGNVAVLTHSKPDGDALGSTLAVTRALELAGVQACAWYFGPMPNWSEAMIGSTAHVVSLASDTVRPSEVDGVVVVDTGAWVQLREIEPWLRGRADHTALIDHHLHGDPDVADRRLIDTSAAAACEPCADVCAELLGVGVEHLPVEVATPLYTGIATDTGWFRFSNTTARAMRTAAVLLEAGVDQPWVYRTVELRERPSRLKLMGRVLASMELVSGGRVAVMSITLDDMREAGAEAGDTGGFADMALRIEAVRVSVVLTETPRAVGDEGPITKISMRSKEMGDGSVDVNNVARTLGGGGHARAAGARASGTIRDVRQRVIDALSGVVA